MLPNIVKGANKKGVSWLYFIMYLILIIVVIVVITKVYKAIKNGANDVGNLAADAAKSAQTGIPIARLQQIRNIAETLFKDRFSGVYVWLFEDWNEDAFITALNQMTSTQEVQILCSNYTELGDRSIAYVLKTSFKNSDIQQLKTGYYSTALNA